MLRKLYYLTFGGLPKYLVVKKRGNYFPMKKNITGYAYMLDNRIGGCKWKHETNKHVSLGFPRLHACGTLKKAKRKIKKLDDNKIKEVDWDPPKYFISDSDEEYYYETIRNKEFVKNSSDKNSLETSSDDVGLITA